jgi:transposase
MPRHAQPLTLSVSEAKQLNARVQDRRSTQQVVLRARIVLLAAQQWENQDIAAELTTTAHTVGVRRRRFVREQLPGLEDAPRSGRPASLAAATVTKGLTTVTQPPQGRTRWSVRSMARHAGLSKSRVPQLWQANDLKPHRLRTFKLSKDPQFAAKFWDVLGLYLNPPQRALVLCCDEKSQCQALERSQPGLPLGLGHIRTRTHDYVRHGTTTLFAALSTLDGRVIARTETRHTHVEWLRFLRQIERETPPELTLHLIADNYATHKHSAVKAWLARHPRIRQHFTPTSSSWLNLVERFFSRPHRGGNPRGQLPKRAGVGAHHQRLAGRTQPPTAALCLAGRGSRHLGKNHPRPGQTRRNNGRHFKDSRLVCRPKH